MFVFEGGDRSENEHGLRRYHLQQQRSQSVATASLLHDHPLVTSLSGETSDARQLHDDVSARLLNHEDSPLERIEEMTSEPSNACTTLAQDASQSIPNILVTEPPMSLHCHETMHPQLVTPATVLSTNCEDASDQRCDVTKTEAFLQLQCEQADLRAQMLALEKQQEALRRREKLVSTRMKRMLQETRHTSTATARQPTSQLTRSSGFPEDFPPSFLNSSTSEFSNVPAEISLTVATHTGEAPNNLWLEKIS